MRKMKRMAITIEETPEGWVATLGTPPGFGHAGYSMRRVFGEKRETHPCASPSLAAAVLIGQVWDRHPSPRVNGARR